MHRRSSSSAPRSYCLDSSTPRLLRATKKRLGSLASDLTLVMQCPVESATVLDYILNCRSLLMVGGPMFFSRGSGLPELEELSYHDPSTTLDPGT